MILNWCANPVNPIIPTVFNELKSYYEQLWCLLNKVNELAKSNQDIWVLLQTHETEITDLQNEVAQLLNNLENGKYLEEYLDQIQKWIDYNFIELIGNAVKYVIFGLTDDGHFTALIPTAWDFITFNTIVDPDDPLYGHLLLRW